MQEYLLLYARLNLHVVYTLKWFFLFRIIMAPGRTR